MLKLKRKKLYFVIILVVFLFCCKTENSKIYSYNKSVNFYDNDFKMVLKYSIKQDWLLVLHYLSRSLNSAETIDKSNFVIDYLISLKFLIPTLPIDSVLKNTFNDNLLLNEYVDDLISIQKEYPLTLKWNKESVRLKWIENNKISISHLMGLNYESLPVIETHINGKPVRLLVDTGAERTVLFKDIAKNVGLKNISIGSVESVFIQGSNNRTNKANYTILESLNIGELEVKNNIAYILKRPFGMDFIDGSLGWDIISRIKLEIDAENKRITIYPSLPLKIIKMLNAIF